MNTAVPNWICAVCLVIITIWIIEKRAQEEVLSHQLKKLMESFGVSANGSGTYKPHSSRHSSEWNR